MGAAQTRYCRKRLLLNRRPDLTEKLMPSKRTRVSTPTKRQPPFCKWCQPFLGTDDRGPPRGASFPRATSPFPLTHLMLGKSICVPLPLLGRSQSANGLEGLPAYTSATSTVRGRSQSPTSAGPVISQTDTSRQGFLLCSSSH